MPKRHQDAIAIIGPGRLGQALGRLLARAGVPVHFIAARRLAAARRGARFIGRGRPVTLIEFSTRAVNQVRIILLAVSDSAVREVAAALAGGDHRRGRIPQPRDWSDKIVLHTCGSLPTTGSASVLRPLRLRGASVGSLHPFQTIPSPAAGVRNLVGCFWGIEGDPTAARVAMQWVKLLRGTAFRVPSRQKTLYHAAAFLACPTVVTLMDHSERLLMKSGVPERIARPMLGQFVSQTAKNFVEFGGRRALTGPAVRGDWATIARHRRALRRASPDVLPIYESLLGAMLRLASREKRKPESRRKRSIE